MKVWALSDDKQHNDQPFLVGEVMKDATKSKDELPMIMFAKRMNEHARWICMALLRFAHVVCQVKICVYRI